MTRKRFYPDRYGKPEYMVQTGKIGIRRMFGPYAHNRRFSKMLRMSGGSSPHRTTKNKII